MFQVRPTQNNRGNGAFAVADIPAGTHVGDYEGELLDEAAYWQRYPSGVVSAFTMETAYFNMHACAQSHGVARHEEETVIASLLLCLVCCHGMHLKKRCVTQ